MSFFVKQKNSYLTKTNSLTHFVIIKNPILLITFFPINKVIRERKISANFRWGKKKPKKKKKPKSKKNQLKKKRRKNQGQIPSGLYPTGKDTEKDENKS